jgi:carbamoyltransferase
MLILGIHDGFDAGAALVDDSKIIIGVNEERFTRRKNEIGFPYNSVRYISTRVDPTNIEAVAIAWKSGSSLIRRFYPNFEEKRRFLWRREVPDPSSNSSFIKNLFYQTFQDSRPFFLWNSLGKLSYFSLRKNLLKFGVVTKKIFFIDHHLCHASGAYYTSGIKKILIITLDGSGDGLSGSVNIGDNSELTRIKEFPASSSLGIFFGAATLALGMRYSEDEGKLMSLAAYEKPIEMPEFQKIIKVQDGSLHSNSPYKYEFALSRYFKKNILSKFTKEKFAAAVQSHLEKCVTEIVDNAISETGQKNLAVGGGVFSNVILNMKLRELPTVKKFYVFPHMSDGGLALGAALYLQNVLYGAKVEKLKHLYLGPSFNEDYIISELKKSKLNFEFIPNIGKHIGHLISQDNIILWFCGNMEFGPRALGNRSILAPAWNVDLKNQLNMKVKKRPYFQPFCPTILESFAKKCLEDYHEPNRFMTMGYHVKQEFVENLKAVIHIDRTTRPQTTIDKNTRYLELLKEIKKESGIGAVLNTSFNIHGEPIVCSPKNAIETFIKTGLKYLVLENFLVSS